MHAKADKRLKKSKDELAAVTKENRALQAEITKLEKKIKDANLRARTNMT